MLQAVSNRLPQPRVRLHSLFFELGKEPSVELLHHRLAMLLVKAQSRLRQQAPFLGLRIIAVDLAQGLQHEPAFLGKFGVTCTKRRRAWALSWAQDNAQYLESGIIQRS